MKPEQTAWLRLVAAARRVQDDRDSAAPYGFSTRVAATAFAGERSTGAWIERFSWRALGVAGLLALISVASNFKAIASPLADDYVFPNDTIVTELFDLY